MSAEELENYEAEVELSLYREYRDVVSQFSYVVETERRFYLANAVELIPHTQGNDVYYEVRMSDAWVWDMYRSVRFVRYVRVITYKDVNIEELDKFSFKNLILSCLLKIFCNFSKIKFLSSILIFYGNTQPCERGFENRFHCLCRWHQHALRCPLRAARPSHRDRSRQQDRAEAHRLAPRCAGNP